MSRAAIAAGLQTVLTGTTIPAIKTFFGDLPMFISPDQSPALAIWCRRWRETRVSGPGGTAGGDKNAIATWVLVLQTVGTNGNSSADGEAHADLIESIIGVLRATPVGSVGVQVMDNFSYDRLAPMVDSQGIAYVTFILVQTTIFLGG